MRLRSSRFAVGLVLLICCWATHGNAGLAQVNVSAWPQVRVEVVGMDGNGDPLKDLTADMLQVTEDGKPVKVLELKPVAGPMSVCIMIDASGSMYDKKENVTDTATRLLTNLAPEDDVCVVNFSVAAYVDAPLTTDRQADLKALTYYKASGGTALYDALKATAGYMRKFGHQQSRAIVLLSDGGDNASSIKLTQLRAELEPAGSPAIYLINIPVSLRGSPGSSGTREEEKAAIELAKMGGGVAYYPRKSAELEAAVDQLTDILKARYVLTYESANPGKDGRERRVSVELDKVHQKAKAIVRAPEGYYAPAQ